MNLPNSITMSRIACVPLLIWILSPSFPLQGHGAMGLRGGEQEVIASVVFILASITDGLDGYLARRRKQITTMGMLLSVVCEDRAQLSCRQRDFRLRRRRRDFSRSHGPRNFNWWRERCDCRLRRRRRELGASWIRKNSSREAKTAAATIVARVDAVARR